MALPAEYRAQMISAIADALDSEFQALAIPHHTATRVSNLIEQLQRNAAAIIRDVNSTPCSWQNGGAPLRQISETETNVVPLRRPAQPKIPPSSIG